jgi:hypothetical protein
MKSDFTQRRSDRNEGQEIISAAASVASPRETFPSKEMQP